MDVAVCHAEARRSERMKLSLRLRLAFLQWSWRKLRLCLEAGLVWSMVLNPRCPMICYATIPKVCPGRLKEPRG